MLGYTSLFYDVANMQLWAFHDTDSA